MELKTPEGSVSEHSNFELLEAESENDEHSHSEIKRMRSLKLSSHNYMKSLREA